MSKYVCSICGYVYDEAAGIPDKGIAPGTKWEDLPDNWVCPLCGASKEAFGEKKEQSEPRAAKAEAMPKRQEAGERRLSAAELSILCSNLAKGCEKQYLTEEAGLFTQLADYYQSKAAPAQEGQLAELLALIQGNLERDYPNANETAAQAEDRGTKRALVWSEKVTRMLASLLSRYEREGDSLLEKTNVYVCEICGFVYIGDVPPEICPVCKVPNLKIQKLQRR